ncbi:type VII secretion protein EccE [Dactylosporangium sp. NPDC005555]|uniref:type VII secretion protein EccE n=1 Tax=Dactylosporangium sp. NPDC005555 TaxID=3154889 RepID=UPI0033B100A2
MGKVVYVVLAQAALALSVLAWTVHPAWALGFALAPVGLLGLRSGRLSGGDLLGTVRPGALMSSVDIDGVDVGVVEDADGLAATIRVGDLSALLGDPLSPFPTLSALLPPAAADLPAARIQLLVSAAAPPDRGPPAVSYRQLTDGKVPAHRRVLLSVRVRRAGGYQREDLERSLVATVRRACRQLGKAGLTARPLSAPSALTALAETARHEPDLPLRETRRGLEVGGLQQAVFRLRRWPQEGPLATKLLTLPCSAVTVALTTTSDDSGPGSTTASGALSPPTGGAACRAELAIRLAAATPAALDQAIAALHRLAATHDATVTRLTGAQFDALAATLPLGGGAPADAAALAGLLTGRDDLTADGTVTPSVSAGQLAALTSTTGPAGLMLGMNRHGAPVTIHPFRPEPTRTVLIGGLPCAQMLALRVLALGAHVTVQSTRPAAWSPFLRGLGGEQIALLPAGQPAALPPPSPTHPQLLILDPAPAAPRPMTSVAGPPSAAPRPAPATSAAAAASVAAAAAAASMVIESAWRATLVIRDELTPGDADLLTRADLVFLQPLTPPEAVIATDVLGLEASASWLTRIPPEMLGIVVSRHTVRWAHLSPTPIELQLTGGPAR